MSVFTQHNVRFHPATGKSHVPALPFTIGVKTKRDRLLHLSSLSLRFCESSARNQVLLQHCFDCRSGRYCLKFFLAFKTSDIMNVLKVGQLAGVDERFCPVAAVAKWPYRHLFGDESDKVSKEYFANGRFRSREWTM